MLFMRCHVSGNFWKSLFKGVGDMQHNGDSWMGGYVTSDGFLFQVREQLGEITMRAQREPNGPAEAQPSQVRVHKSQRHPSLPVREYWTVTRTLLLRSCFCLSMT